MDKQFVQNTILGVFNKIIELINEYNSVEIDLGTFGKFLCFDRTLTFEPLLKAKAPLNMK